MIAASRAPSRHPFLCVIALQSTRYRERRKKILQEPDYLINNSKKLLHFGFKRIINFYAPYYSRSFQKLHYKYPIHRQENSGRSFPTSRGRLNQFNLEFILKIQEVPSWFSLSIAVKFKKAILVPEGQIEYRFQEIMNLNIYFLKKISQ